MRRALIVGAVGLLIGAGLAVRNLAWAEWNPTVMIKFGEAFPDDVEYAERLLGEVVVAPMAGHDGKFFFVQAMDPLYLDPDVHAIHLDRPAYRAQRMLYPLLAGGFGFFSAWSTAWGLVTLNVLALGLGTLFTARLAQEIGLSPWLGLVFGLNPGLIVELGIDGSGILAMVGLVIALLATGRRNAIWTAIGLSIAVLSRETMVVGTVGIALWWFAHIERRRALIIGLVPISLGLSWWIYLKFRLPVDLIQDTQAIGPPLRGLLLAIVEWRDGLGGAIDAIVAGVLVVAGLRLLLLAFKPPSSSIVWASAGYFVLAIVLSQPVWARYFDSSRALAPILTCYPLAVLDRLTRQPASAECIE